MMKPLLFSSLFAILLIDIASVQGQSVPQKCCDPMLMPVDGKCERVPCLHDGHCNKRFQAYCTEHNTGVAFCRGLSWVCGCNGERSERDKHPTGPNCPENQKCGADGKCPRKPAPPPPPPIPPKCCDPMLMPMNGGCQRVKCYRELQCTQFQKYCNKYNTGQAICRTFSEVCGCSGETSERDKNPTGLNCPPNQACDASGKCFPKK